MKQTIKTIQHSWCRYRAEGFTNDEKKHLTFCDDWTVDEEYSEVELFEGLTKGDIKAMKELLGDFYMSNDDIESLIDSDEVTEKFVVIKENK